MSAARAYEQYSVDELKKMNKHRLEVIDTRQARKRKQKEREKIKWRVMGVASFLAFMVFALVILVPLQHVVSEIFVTSYSISELKQEIARLETKKKDLIVRIDTAYKPESLEQEATRLGMVVAGEGDKWRLPTPKTADTQEDEDKTELTQNPSNSN